MKLAIISDLHIGHGSRSSDLTPHADDKKTETDFLIKFSTFAQNNNIRADALIVPGDITNRAHAEEFRLASDICTFIADQIGVAHDNIFFTPGNHDVDWSVMNNPPITPLQREQRYAPFKSRCTALNAVMATGAASLFEAPYFTIWRTGFGLVVSYNSASHDDPGISVHHGMIDQDHLQHLRNALQGVAIAPDTLKVFIAHHHVTQYSDPIENEPDFSIMNNAGNLLTLLNEYHFDIFIHGHKHCPHFETHIINSGQPLAILGAGSFCHKLDSRLHGVVSNQFHLIEVEGRDNDTGTIFGTLSNWSYLTIHGWVPSELRGSQIEHRLAFGTYLLPGSLERTVSPRLLASLNGQRVAAWSQIVVADNRLKYLPLDLVRRFLLGIAQRNEAILVGDNPSNWILVKQEVYG